MNNREFQQLLVDSGLAIPDPKTPGKLVFNVGGSALTEARMSDLQPELIEDPAAAGSKTLAGLYTAFTTWKTNNAGKTAIFISVMGGDGVPGIIALYK